MSSVVEQCDSAQVEVRPSTLEIFDKFKPSLEDETKSESDESFHLPMLGEDDESGKSVISNDKDNSCHNGETEDDILNKFDTVASDTPDNHLIDDSILDDDEDIDKNNEENNKQIETHDEDTTEGSENKDIDESSQNNEEISNTESLEQLEEHKECTDDATNNEECDDTNKESDFISQYETDDINERKDNASENVDNIADNEDNTTENCLDNVHEENTEKLNEDNDDNISNLKENETMEEETFVDAVEELGTDLADKVEAGESKTDATNDVELMEEETVAITSNLTIEDVKEVEDPIDTNDDKDIPTDEANDIVQETNLIDSVEDAENTGDPDPPVEKPEVEQSVKSKETTNVEDVEEQSSITPMEDDDNTDVEESSALESLQCPQEEPLPTEQIDNINKDVELEHNELNDTEMVCPEESSINEDTKTASEIEDTDGDQFIDEDQGADIAAKDPLDCESDDVIMEESIESNVNTVPHAEESMEVDCAKDNESDVSSKIVEIEPVVDEDVTLVKDKVIPESVKTSESSNDSTKNNQEGDEDLLDITIIRDTEEDDACAIATAIEDNSAKEQDEATAGSSDKSETNDEERSEHVTDDTSDRDNNEDPIDLDCDEEVSCDTTTGKSDSDKKSEDISSSNSSYKKLEGSDKDITNNCDKSDKRTSNAVEIVNDSEKDKETSSADKNVETIGDSDVIDISEKSKTGKRSLSRSDIISTEVAAKKRKIFEQEPPQKTQPKVTVKPTEPPPKPVEKTVKTLTEFEKFMKTRKFMKRLTRSDLEQFCLQKICECIMLKSTDGELHQTIKKQDKVIENLRKDIQQLTKQAKDLEIVNRKLMSEFRSNLGNKKPLVPLRITRSVGLQVRLNANIEPITPTNTVRRRQSGTAHTPLKNATAGNVTTPLKATATTPTNTSVTNTTANRRVLPAQSSAVRQIGSSPVKTTATSTTPASNPLLSQALQRSNSGNAITRPPAAIAAKRTNTPIRPKPLSSNSSSDSTTSTTSINSTNKTPSPAAKQASVAVATAAANQSVIDLTDEDDRAKQPMQPVKVISKPFTVSKTVLNNTSAAVKAGIKTMVVSSSNTGNKVTTPTRTIATLPQGVRLTSSQVKNATGIAIPTITSSSSGTTQLMYVLPTISSSGGGPQKLAFVNIQPTNGVLSSALNGSTMSVVPNKQNNTVTLKTMATRKHPAPLPSPPRSNVVDTNLKPILPKPHLTIRKTDVGIILQWKMPYNLDDYETIASYQLYAYQLTSSPPSSDMWRKVGDVKALALPMACTLTQFADKNKYYFAVRSVDVHKRIGVFSDPEEITL